MKFGFETRLMLIFGSQYLLFANILLTWLCLLHVLRLVCSRDRSEFFYIKMWRHWYFEIYSCKYVCSLGIYQNLNNTALTTILFWMYSITKTLLKIREAISWNCTFKKIFYWWMNQLLFVCKKLVYITSKGDYHGHDQPGEEFCCRLIFSNFQYLFFKWVHQLVHFFTSNDLRKANAVWWPKIVKNCLFH